MIDPAIRLRRAELKASKDVVLLATIRDVTLALIGNPIIELVAGIAAISYLNKGNSSWLESITGIDLKAGGEYAGLIAVIGLQQVAPLIPSVLKAGTDNLGTLSKSLPSLLPLLALGA